MLAAAVGVVQAVEQALLRSDILVDDLFCEETGDSLLHIAAAYGKIEVISLLTSHGADKTLLNRAGECPSQKAFSAGHVDAGVLLQPGDSVARLPSPTDTKIERGFKVVVVAGRNMPLKPWFGPRFNWFARGKSDPYIKVVCCGEGWI